MGNRRILIWKPYTSTVDMRIYTEKYYIFYPTDSLSPYLTEEYPIWHGHPPGLSIFLENYDFSGKTIVPFCTSHSSGIGSSATNLHSLCSDTVEWAEGRRFEAGTSRETMEEWLSSIGVK